MANHLEQLLAEYFEHDGYFVRRNVRVGKLPGGGFRGELDVVAYHPIRKQLLHVEPSGDADTWAVRESRYKKKFDVGREYILEAIFPFLPKDTKIEQWAVLFASNKSHSKIGGGRVVPVWRLYGMIAKYVIDVGPPGSNAIPENFPLLRTMQNTLYWCLDDEDRARLRSSIPDWLQACGVREGAPVEVAR